MNRRGFLKSLTLGSLAVFGGLALTRTLSANRQSGRVDWSILNCKTGERIIYTFRKGPGYVDAEQAFPHMQKIVDNTWAFMPESERALSDNVVLLESVTLGKV